MYILTKDSVIYGSCDSAEYFKLQSNGYYVPCNFAKCTHMKVGETFYNETEYRLLQVEQVPETLETDGTWVFDGAEIVQDADLTAEYLRGKRDTLLGETDWAICLDSPLDAERKSVIMGYRQALRDMPQQEGFPFDVVIPTLAE